MKRHFLIAWIAGLVLFSTCATALESPVIDVQLVSHSKANKVASSVVTVTIRNLSKNPVYLPKGLNPLENVQGHLVNDLLTVVGKSGKRAKFVGMYNHIVTNDPAGFYTRIGAGESRSRDLDISADYDLSADEEYTVGYEQPFTTEIKMTSEGDIDSGARAQASETTSIWIGSGDKSGLLKNRFSSAQVNNAEPDTCTSDQRTAVSKAIGGTVNLSARAFNAIESLNYDVVGKNADGTTTYTPTIKADDNYIYWFGPAKNTNPPYLSPDAGINNFWKTNDDYVMMRTIDAIVIRAGGGTFLCGCKDGTDINTVAQTETFAHVTRVCVPKFFNQKANDGGKDSQLLTIIHEYSHYQDDYGDSTGDYTYNPTPSHNMTLTDRYKAIRNADNIMYYIGTFNK